jgi:hypothetical protein
MHLPAAQSTPSHPSGLTPGAVAQLPAHPRPAPACSSVLAQLGWPDMRLPIMYTMSWPERVMASDKTWPRLDFVKMGDLTFRAPDNKKYPAMDLAYAAGRMGGTMTGVLSAANEQVGLLLLLSLTLVLRTCMTWQQTLLPEPHSRPLLPCASCINTSQH